MKLQENHNESAVMQVERHLKHTLEDFVSFVLPGKIDFRWVDAYFPFTHPSWELEIKYQDTWIEVLGAGIVENKILENNKVSGAISWAAGFGLERLAMIRYNIPDIRIFWSKDTGIEAQFKNRSESEQFSYKPISKHPQIANDMSFWITEAWHENDFFEIVRSLGGDLVEQVIKIDEYVNQEGRKSHCYRIVYRSYDRTLTQSEVTIIHKSIADEIVKQCGVEMR